MPPALHHPFGPTLPEPGRLQTLTPGVHWLRLALPFALDHINVWLLDEAPAAAGGPPGWSLVDTGLDDPATRATWQALLDGPLAGRPLQRLVVTHLHPDHVGLAHWLAGSEGAPLWMSAGDWLSAQRQCGAGAPDNTGLAAHYARHGVEDPAVLDGIRARSGLYGRLVPRVPGSYHRLLDGRPLALGGCAWTPIAGYGHAPEHMALFRPAQAGSPPLLISGDMLLPRISTHVGVPETEPEADALGLFLDSIERFRALPEDTLVLPSHGLPFGRVAGAPQDAGGLHARVEALQAHHRERLAEVEAACAQAPQTAWQLLPRLFRRPLDLHQTSFAMGESIAHLHRLWHAGRLLREARADGVWTFRLADAVPPLPDNAHS